MNVPPNTETRMWRWRGSMRLAPTTVLNASHQIGVSVRPKSEAAAASARRSTSRSTSAWKIRPTSLGPRARTEISPC
eukprot:4495528-Pyramimonas_sp.AAC.1